MKVSDKGIELITSFEGFNANPYRCPAGIPTIGYGCTYYPDGKKVSLSDAHITKEQGIELLKNVLSSFEKSVTKAINVSINQNQFDALVSLSYNIGQDAFAKSTLLRKLNDKDPKGEVADQFLRWDKASGMRLAGLTKRREAEKELFLS